jgi:hypothetical protein
VRGTLEADTEKAFIVDAACDRRRGLREAVKHSL